MKNLRTLIFFLILIGLLAIPGYQPGALAGHGETMTILFTHDMHDHLLPVKDLQDGIPVESGGFARLQSAVNAQRQDHPGALLVDGGDFSMGTPFQTIFSSDAPELRIMGRMGYDVTTLGNHEFDYRAAGLAESLTIAKASGDPLPQLVQSNTVFPTDKNGSLTPTLAALQQAYQICGIKDYTIVEKNGLRIGIFGLMGRDAAAKAPMSEVRFADPIENARRVVNILDQQEKVDMIICLSHCGTGEEGSDPEDETLAREVPGIDVIISGHYHSKFTQPLVINNTIIGASEDSCKYLGVIDLVRQENSWALSGYELVPINDQLPADAGIAAMVSAYKERVQKTYFDQFGLQYDQVLAAAPFNFHNINDMIKVHQEDPLGNLVSDAYVYAVQKAEGRRYVPVDAAIVPVGTIRGSFYQGNVTAADAFTASSLGIGPDNIPGYPLISVYLTGAELKTVCEVDASISPMMEDAQLFMSGVDFEFNPHRLIFNKVIGADLHKPDNTIQEIDDARLYRVAVGLYSAQMLSVVGDKSFGLLSIVPKNREGTPISDFEAQVIKDDADGSEVKEWEAIAAYMQSFPIVNGVPEIPSYYSQTHNRKVINQSTSIADRFSHPNKIALALYAVVIVLVLLLIVIIARIISHRRRKLQSWYGRDPKWF